MTAATDLGSLAMTKEFFIRFRLLVLGRSRTSTIALKDITGLARQREKKFLVITAIGQGSTFIAACVGGASTSIQIVTAALTECIFDFGILQQRMRTSTQVAMRSIN